MPCLSLSLAPLPAVCESRSISQGCLLFLEFIVFVVDVVNVDEAVTAASRHLFGGQRQGVPRPRQEVQRQEQLQQGTPLQEEEEEEEEGGRQSSACAPRLGPPPGLGRRTSPLIGTPPESNQLRRKASKSSISLGQPRSQGRILP